MASLPDGMVLRTGAKDKDRFRAEDCDNPDFFIDGILTTGTVSFTVVAEVNGRSGKFSGRDFFYAMLAHFGTRRVKIISAHWSDARSELKTNLDIFNTETKEGATKADAAFATHTGRWSKAKGFAVIVNLDTTPDDLPGGYEQVLVDFGKPPPKPRKRK
jgi:hypothetical protein